MKEAADVFESQEFRSRRIGKYLKKARIEAELTQTEVAHRVTALGQYLSQSLLTQYETGRIADPSPKMLRMLALVYGVNFVELVLTVVRERYQLDKEEDWKLIESALIQKSILRSVAEL